MVKLHKEKWRGQELISKIGLYSFFGLEILLFPILDLFEASSTSGILLIMGLVIYFLLLAYIGKSYSEKFTKEYGGIRRWKTNYNMGQGRTGKLIMYISDQYLLKKSPTILKKQTERTVKIIYDTEESITTREPTTITEDLSLVEESKVKKEDAIQDLRDRNIIDKIRGEYVEDKLLLEYYKTKTKKEAFIKGKATKAFLVWKKTESSGIFREEIKKQIKALGNKQSQKDLKERRLEKIAEELALRATLNEIIAADKQEAEGGAVHAFLMTHYDDYNDLIKKDYILDRAQEIAKEIWVPKVNMVISKVHLKDCVKTIVDLYEEAYFDHEPHLPFKKLVVFSFNPFLDAVDWKEKVPKTIHYFPDIPVTNGESNIKVLTRIVHNVPMVFIAHSSGTDYFVRDLEFDPDEIKKAKKDAQVILIEDLQIQLDETKEKARDSEKRERSEMKRKVQYKDQLEVLSKFYAKEHLRQNDPRSVIEKNNIGKGLLYGVVIIIVIFLVIFLINMSNTSSLMTNSTNTLSLFSTGMKNLIYLRS